MPLLVLKMPRMHLNGADRIISECYGGQLFQMRPGDSAGITTVLHTTVPRREMKVSESGPFAIASRPSSLPPKALPSKGTAPQISRNFSSQSWPFYTHLLSVIYQKEERGIPIGYGISPSPHPNFSRSLFFPAFTLLYSNITILLYNVITSPLLFWSYFILLLIKM